MKKQFLTLSLLFLFGIGLYAQPKPVGEPRMIAKAEEPLQTPVWSPDGKKLSFNNGQWEVSGDGTGLRRVSSVIGSGSGIKRMTANSNAVLQQMLDHPTKVASQVEGLKSLGEFMIFNPLLSPKGDMIVFEVSRGRGMYVCNADGSGLRSLGTRIERATWTPDGKYVVVMVTGDDGHTTQNGELFSINVATGAKTAFLSSAKYIALNPAISPDGTKLAFESFADGTIYVIDIN
jgi:Tol biopolymer transport system component